MRIGINLMIQTAKRTKRMVLLLVFTAVMTSAANILDSKPAGAINDFANILSGDTKARLEQVCTQVQEKTGVAMVLATFASLEGYDIDDAANRLYQRWGIGKKGSDAGVLVLLGMAEREIRIETGYGVEGYITDYKATAIRREATGQFLSKNRYDQGITMILYSLTNLITEEKNISFAELVPGNFTTAPVRGVQRQPAETLNPLQILLIVLVVIFLLGSRTGRTLLFWFLLSSLSGRRGSFGGGGFGGGGSFGGFGGGMSGGGGSSGGF
jgi:uncharacterized protein